jgi:hypothetical protein
LLLLGSACIAHHSIYGRLLVEDLIIGSSVVL